MILSLLVCDVVHILASYMLSLKMATIHLWIDVAPFVCGGVFGLFPGSGRAASRRRPKSNALECVQLQSEQALRPMVRLMYHLDDGMNYFCFSLI